VNGKPLSRTGKYEAAQILAGQSPEIWISLTDDKTPINNLKNVTLNWSTDPANFDSTKEVPMNAGPNKDLLGLLNTTTTYFWNTVYDGSKNIENDVVWFRVTVSDSKNKDYRIPNTNSMFLLKTYFAIKFN
jgi:hypothetical protein